MQGQGAPSPSPAMKRVFRRAVARAVTVATAIVVAYFVLPFDHVSDLTSVVLLTLGLIVLVLLIVWQIRSILKDDYPAIRGAMALATIVPLFLVLFAAVYYLMERASGANFTQHMTRLDALYFTVTVFSTVGFGDITAKSEVARAVVTIQIVLDLLLIGFGLRLLLTAVRLGRQRRDARQAD